MSQVVNGCTQRPHFYQIMSYFFYVGISTVDLVLFGEGGVALLVLYVVSLVLSVTSTLYTTLIDPTDSMVLTQRRGQTVQSSDLFCDHCRAYVDRESKHCRRCDRCTEGFDHHCKWVNNCIGKINYRSFIIMINSVMAQFILGIINKGRILTNIKRSHHNYNALVIMCIVTLIPSCIAVMGLLQLIVFHFYLITKGMTTYTYIQVDRKEQLPRKVSPIPATDEVVKQLKIESEEQPRLEPQFAASFSLEVEQNRSFKKQQSSGQLTNFDLDRTPQVRDSISRSQNESASNNNEMEIKQDNSSIVSAVVLRDQVQTPIKPIFRDFGEDF